MSESADRFEVRAGGEVVWVSGGLLERYDVVGPRYTSYPTAPEWTEGFGAEEFRRALEGASRWGRPLSVYMHLPFCRSLCLFCGCNVVIPKTRGVARPYLERLKREMELVGEQVGGRRKVVQFHWGGGTPTWFTAGELEELFGAVRERFEFAPGAEVGVEVDPRVTELEQLEVLRRLGFNRLSMGVQDFDARVQRAVRRVQSYERTRELFEAARALGYESINVDLIYGLPHQTVESFSRTLEQVIGMGPDRVAMYSYAHVPWMKKQQGSFARYLPSGREKFRLFCTGLWRFTEAGYRFIGFDHFARPEDELCRAQEEGTLTRNFQGYTTRAGADLLAFGVSAISDLTDAYAQNFRDLPSYERRIDAGELATMRGWWLTEEDRLRRAVILRLLCHCRLEKRPIEREFGIDFDRTFAPELERLALLERDGLVRLSPEEISVTLLGRVFLRVVGMAFDAYLHRHPSHRTLFSRTI